MFDGEHFCVSVTFEQECMKGRCQVLRRYVINEIIIIHQKLYRNFNANCKKIYLLLIHYKSVNGFEQSYGKQFYL